LPLISAACAEKGNNTVIMLIVSIHFIDASSVSGYGA
jgi:hypothetical protein